MRVLRKCGEREISLAAAIIGVVILSGCAANAPTRHENAAQSSQRWTDRLIPMPKKIVVAGSVTESVENITLDMPDIDSPRAKTVRALFSPFAKGNMETATVLLTARVISWDAPALPPDVRALKSAPNSDQAYAIIHETKNGKRIYRLLASTPEGLLYAARTFAALVMPLGKNSGITTVELPFLMITDWPDIADRGAWGCYGYYNLDWYARWKLNSYDHHFIYRFDMERPTADSEKLPPVTIAQTDEQKRLVRHAAEVGVRVVPIIPHIGDGQMKLIRDIQEDSALAFAKDILARSGPNDGEKARGLCMSNAKTTRLLADCFVAAAAMAPFPRKPCVIWLTEGGNLNCYCDQCRGRNGYLLEASGIIKSFEQARQRAPGLELRLMSSQGSYPVDRQILGLLPSGAGFVYYNGFLCYSADHQPLIPDYLAESASNGRYVSTLMDANPSFFAIFPGSMPQFIRFRARELRDKRLSGVVAFCVPDRHFYEVNMAALAEWTWNANGRSAKDFARAFATITGIRDPILYAEWLERAGEAAWWLADSRFIEALCYKPAAIMNPIVPGYPKGDVRMKIYPIPELDKTLENAREALALANRSGDALMKYESACVLAGLYAYELAEAIREDKRQNAPITTIATKIDRLERYAGQIQFYHDAWYRAVVSRKTTSPKSPLYPLFGKEFGETYKVPRLSMPEYALFRACDAWRAALGLPTTPVAGKWTTDDFKKNNLASLSFDITRLVPETATTVRVFLEHERGGGVIYNGMFLSYVDSQSDTPRTIAVERNQRRLNSKREECWIDETFRLPTREKNTRLKLNISLENVKLARPLHFNPLTDGISNATISPTENIAGKALARWETEDCSSEIKSWKSPKN